MYSLLLRRDMGRPPSPQDIIEGGKKYIIQKKSLFCVMGEFFPLTFFLSNLLSAENTCDRSLHG